MPLAIEITPNIIVLLDYSIHYTYQVNQTLTYIITNYL